MENKRVDCLHVGPYWASKKTAKPYNSWFSFVF